MTASRPVRIVREPLPFRATRAELVARLVDAHRLFALLGGGPTAEGRYSAFAIRPADEFVVAAGAPPAAPPAGVWGAAAPRAADVFDALRAFATRYRAAPDPAVPGPTCGVFALLGFDLRTHVERLPDVHAPDRGCPDLLARLHPTVLVHDGADDGLEIRRMVDDADAAFTAAAADVAGELRVRAALGPPVRDAAPPRARPTCSDRPEDFRAKVARVVEHARAGDVYQLNLAQRFDGPCAVDAASLAARLLAENPAAFGGLVRLSDDAAGNWLVSASPERFLRVAGRDVLTRPIKGTAPRGADAAEDAARAAALRASPKERAELAMIVDLLRNDLSATCAPGSVAVRDPWALESHPTVHHLTAEVVGELEAGRDLFDLLRAAWPGGSISGCPKIRALEIVDGLEAFRRGPYTGSLAAFSCDGRADLNLLIRSLRLQAERAWTWGGGGVTVDSDPEAERVETLHKVRGLFAALNWEWSL